VWGAAPDLQEEHAAHDVLHSASLAAQLAVLDVNDVPHRNGLPHVILQSQVLRPSTVKLN
jgi:hypothetical protein